MPKRISPQRELFNGARDTLPLTLVGLPAGIIFGALITAGGLPDWTAASMSLFVYAGSAQLIGAGMVAQGVPLLWILLTMLVVNLRHVLYALSIGPYLKHLPQRWLLPLGFALTDETYAVTIQRYNRLDTSPHKHWYMFGSALAMYINWQLYTLLGMVIGQKVENVSTWGLDFAMIAMFIGIAVPMIRSRPMLLCALFACASAVLLQGLPNRLGFIVAACIGIAAGILSGRLSSPAASRVPSLEETP